MLGGDLCHDVVNHVDETVRFIGLEQVVANIPLAKFSLEAVDCHDVMHLLGPDMLDRVEDTRAHRELHLDQSDLLDGLGEVLSHVVLRIVENDVLRRSKVVVTYRLLVVHVPADPPQKLDNLRLLRSLDDLVVHCTVVRVHRSEYADAGTAPRQPAPDLLALLLPQIPWPVPVIRRPEKHYYNDRHLRFVEVEDGLLLPKGP